MARTRRVLVWLLTALALPMSFVEAAQVTISAQYRGGGSGRFDNTTPPGGMCQYMPYTCRTRQTVALPITYTKQTTKDAADVRDQFYVQLPGRKQIDVYHEQTGEPRQITFDWSAISQEVHGSDVTRIAPGNRDVRGGCRMVTTVSQYRPPIVRYLWDMTSPAAPQPCSVSVLQGGSGQRDTVDVTDTSVAYQLNLPPPYRLPAGIYRGSVVYSVGPGGDFDFGNQVSGLSTNTLTVDFVLDVQHAFIFEFPPGSDRAVLEPRGGWKSRLSGGRPPQRLYRDLPFRVCPPGRSRPTSCASTTWPAPVPSAMQISTRYRWGYPSACLPAFSIAVRPLNVYRCQPAGALRCSSKRLRRRSTGPGNCISRLRALRWAKCSTMPAVPTTAWPPWCSMPNSKPACQARTPDE